MGTDQLRRGPLVNKPRGIPLLVRGTVLLDGALKVVDGEEQLLGGPLVECAVHAVVAGEGLELAAERLALDPICFSYRPSATPSRQNHRRNPGKKKKRNRIEAGKKTITTKYSLIINPP